MEFFISHKHNSSNKCTDNDNLFQHTLAIYCMLHHSHLKWYANSTLLKVTICKNQNNSSTNLLQYCYFGRLWAYPIILGHGDPITQPIAEISIILISAHFPCRPKYDNLQSRWQSHLRQHSKNTCIKLHTQYSLDWKESSYIISSLAPRLVAHQNKFQSSKFSQSSLFIFCQIIIFANSRL